ncbi:MAG: prepilin-type N-terminal cleavage/methylation domain-containing protein [Candidatus Saccharibacteria bacterium]|nr:prepilin-type N-terminal cleavage/methylation domain-containing protein [Candidatus Saccharibacteria bacterium]
MTRLPFCYPEESSSLGFTLVEVIVTLLVATIFVGVILGIYAHISSVNAAIRTHHIADMAAYNNLRRYANHRPPNWFQCTYDAGASLPRPITLVATTDSISGLPGPITQTVVATAPYGCHTNDTNGFPIKIVSTITYGSSGRSVTHATYASY